MLKWRDQVAVKVSNEHGRDVEIEGRQIKQSA